MGGQEEFDGIGFAPGVVRGARSFRVDELGRLTGINFPSVWKPGENVAECRSTYAVDGNTQDYAQALVQSLMGQGSYWNRQVYSLGSNVHPSEASARLPMEADTPHPLDKCMSKHGFYAYYDGSDNYHEKGFVSGVVEGYGEVLIGTRGFRCMKAKIVALCAAEVDEKDKGRRLGLMMARNYPDIPLFESFDAMVQAFPPDGGEKAITPETDPDFWERKI